MSRRRTYGNKKDVFVEFTTSTTWMVPNGVKSIDAFIVAGGASGSRGNYLQSGAGGNGGQTKNIYNISVDPNTNIPIVVGIAGSNSSILGYAEM